MSMLMLMDTDFDKAGQRIRRDGDGENSIIWSGACFCTVLLWSVCVCVCASGLFFCSFTSSKPPRQTPLVNSKAINTSKHQQVSASISAVFSAAIPPSVPSEKSMSVTIDCAQKAILRPVPVRELHSTAHWHMPPDKGQAQA
ncbi:hypothetical protein J3E68DRAFT_296342 [Trichoderma sp. SZMC 28012]